MSETKPWQLNETATDFLAAHIPGYMSNPLLQYIEEGRPVGDFLYNTIIGNLFAAVAHADENNKRCIVQYAQFLMWYAPALAIGSPKKYKLWCEMGGLKGINEGRYDESKYTDVEE